jgi:hypothetical protein
MVGTVTQRHTEIAVDRPVRLPAFGRRGRRQRLHHVPAGEADADLVAIVVQ